MPKTNSLPDGTPEGKRIRAMRMEMHLTQANLGELLGVSVSTVSRWERDFWRPPLYATAMTESLYADWQEAVCDA